MWNERGKDRGSTSSDSLKRSGPPRGFVEQGNMANFNWGTEEERQNILGNKNKNNLKQI